MIRHFGVLIPSTNTTGSRPCKVRVIFRPLSQAAWMVRISRSSVPDKGGQDLLQPC
jgi:hypothetical protein